MGFCTPESRSYGPRSMCADLATVTVHLCQKEHCIDIAKKINTYETSILPYEDCCTIFVPKHPVINPELEKCIKYENSFDYHTLIENAINNIQTITNFQEEFEDLL